MRILPVPRRADGPDLEVMARYCEPHHPKLFVSVSVFRQPDRLLPDAWQRAPRCS